MRLWHKNLIPILPRMQLVGQWRECCLIARQIAVNGTPNHILVNKVMDYPIEHFATYCYNVKWWMVKHGYSPNESAQAALEDYIYKPLYPYVPDDLIFKDWHNDRYLYQCISNLEEKYDCGGIPEEEWVPLENYILEVI